MLPPDERLIQQILTPNYSIRNGKVKIIPKNRTEGRVCMKDLLKHSPDEMDSIILTFGGTGMMFDDLDLS